MITFLFFSLISFQSTATAQSFFVDTSRTVEAKNVSMCKIDLNADNEADIALLVDTDRGQELTVLVSSMKVYHLFRVATLRSKMELSGTYARTLTETTAGRGQKSPRVFQVPGAYLELRQAEGASVAFFWNGKGFTEVWTSD